MLKLFISISFAQSGNTVAPPQCEKNGAISNLSSIMIDGSKNSLCELKVGQSVSLDSEGDYFSQKYRLVKTDAKTYVAEINLQFTDMWDGDVQITNNNKTWRAKVQKCLNKYNPYLKGPNGESLQIQLSKKAPLQVIAVREKGRPVSTNYVVGMNCSIILHETLHLLGLVDEYKETQRGFVMNKSTGNPEYVDEKAETPAYDCRAIGPDNSIMNMEEVATESVFPKNEYEVCTCDDPMNLSFELNIEDYNICRKTLSGIAKSNKKISPNGPCPAKSRSLKYDEAFYKEFKKEILVRSKKTFPPTKKSLLAPAEFRFITKPICESQNSKYNNCTQFAYDSSLTHPNKKCDPQAIECQKNYDWLK